jgi:predicted HicB family RNase H-like nuclease
MSNSPKRTQRTKEGCTNILLRNVPNHVHEQIMMAAAREGLSMRAWILSRVCRVLKEEETR